MGKFYVYEHWRPDKDVCFYVGKGNGRRANDMRRGRNRYHKFIQTKLSKLGMAVEVKIFADSLEEIESFKIEMERIAFWRDLGVDLANLTDGGEGTTGRKHTEEWKQKNAERMRGRKDSPETRAKKALSKLGNKNGLGTKKTLEAIEKTICHFRGKSKSPETKAKISASKIGKPGHVMTRETIEKIRAAQIGRPKSEEAKARMRKPKSEEHKAKLRAANLGKKHSAETRALLSRKAYEQWERVALDKVVGG